MKISRVVKILVTSDFFVNSGFSIFAPVFAIFIAGQITGGSLRVIGFAAAVFQIFKSGLQIPIARILDKNHGEFDDFYSMIFGSLLISTIPFLYLLASTPTHIYIIQAIYGTGAAFTIPPWYAIFTRHVDKMRENVEWSMDSIAIGIGGAGAAAIGGILADKFGFNFVFTMGGFLVLFGALYQMKIYSNIRKEVSRGEVTPQPGRISAGV